MRQLPLPLSLNLVPRALFPGFGGGAGKAPWGRGCLSLPLEIKDKAERKQKDFTIPDLCFFRYLFKHFGGFATRLLFLSQLALLATQLQSLLAVCCI